MRVRAAGLMAVAVLGALIAQGAVAASYQKVDGTIVDPILDRSGNVHPYAGPNLGPGVSIQWAALGNADLAEADLRGASLRQADLVSSDLSGADLSNADLETASLYLSILTNANASNSNLRDSSLSNANLSGINLANSNLTRIWFYQANLSNADLSGSDLTHANLYSANLSGATFTNAYYWNTSFPTGFDPVAAGMITGPIVINNGLAPPNPDNLIERFDVPYIVNNEGCNALIQHPCLSPGRSTAVAGPSQPVYDSFERVDVYETSSFSGFAYDLIAHDQSTADVSVTRGGASAGDQSSVTVRGTVCDSTDGPDAGASGEAYLHIIGGCWDGVSAGGHSTVLFEGGGTDGSDFYVGGNAFVDFRGGIWGLWISGQGRASVRGEVLFWIGVEPNGTLEMEEGNHSDLVDFEVQGTLKMNGGRIGPSGVRVSGYADIRDGDFQAESEAYWNGYGQIPGPWNFIAEGSGLIELSGGQFLGYSGAVPSFGARDESRIRVFGSEFEIGGTPLALGSIGIASGTLHATLLNGDAIETPFAHRGADCGGQPCTGRILVLAPGLDWDQDTVPNPFDNCADEPNADQADLDSNGTGDVCFAPVDLDRDGIVDALDNCRVDVNPDQLDTDVDGVGDACEKELIFWADEGTEGCTTPPKRLPYELVTSDLNNGDVIDRSAQPCDCFGIEYPVTSGTASVRFLHRTESGFVEEYCENVAPYALGLGPNQPICADGLDEDGVHELMVTPYDAPGCEAGGGHALPSSIRSFTMAAPEPGLAVMMGAGVLGLAAISRRRTHGA